MIRTFVRLKSEVTAAMEHYEERGYTTYRVRLNCDCAVNPRRSGILVIDPQTLTLAAKVIRCKGCKNREEAENGNF
jgi:hypothetical protein